MERVVDILLFNIFSLGLLATAEKHKIMQNVVLHKVETAERMKNTPILTFVSQQRMQVRLI